MGKINDVLQRYLSDRERFADLFNIAYFHGNQVVRYTDLKEENALWNLIQSNPFYREISQETAEAASVLMHVEGMWEKRERYLYRSGEEVKYDMCQALQELFEDGRLQGIEQGIERGIEQGIEQGIKVCVALCREFGMDKEGAARQISRKFALDMEKAQEYTDKYWA